MQWPHFERTELIYHNALTSEADVAGFRLEGSARVTFEEGRLHLENALDPALGQSANFVYWCPEEFPDHISVQWDFWPLHEPGLCILFFSARGRNGEDLFAEGLPARTGEYQLYHSGAIDALHVSYFRRKHPKERAFQVCNLRKSHGFHLVAQGADPLPSVEDAMPPYPIELIKSGADVFFKIRDLPIFHWIDDHTSYGPLLGGGKIGFRQMAPLKAAYANLRIHRVIRR